MCVCVCYCVMWRVGVGGVRGRTCDKTYAIGHVLDCSIVLCVFPFVSGQGGG